MALPDANFDQILTLAADSAVDHRSGVFLWLSQNRVEFSEHQSEHTWAAWAQALTRAGVTVKGDRPVTGPTMRQAWWRVRRHFGEPVGEPILGAEKAKVQKRRKPRRPASRIAEPPLQPGEVAPGVRLATKSDQEAGRGGDNLLEKLARTQKWAT
jgi:hypothetical protein